MSVSYYIQTSTKTMHVIELVSHAKNSLLEIYKGFIFTRHNTAWHLLLHSLLAHMFSYPSSRQTIR